MSPKFDMSKSLTPHPGRLPQSVLSLPASERQYDYYEVEVPADITDPDVFEVFERECPESVLQDVLAQRHSVAFMQAEEMSQVWKMPARWDVLYDDGQKIIVRRISRKAG